MAAKDERPWPPGRAPPDDASAGFHAFTGQRSSVEIEPGVTSGGSSSSSSRASSLMQGVLQGDGNGDRFVWPNSRLASADFNTHNNDVRSSMGTDDGYTSFGVIPMNPDGSSLVPVDHGPFVVRQISGRPPVDHPDLIPRSSQANTFVFEGGGVPFSARRGSPLRTPSTGHSFTSSPAAGYSPFGIPRRRASAPPQQPSNLSRVGSFQPRVPSSPHTSPWHGRSSVQELNYWSPWSPSPSDQHMNSATGYFALVGTPSYQAPMWSVGSSSGVPFDNNPSTRSASYRLNSFGTDPGGQMLQSPIHPAFLNRRHTFPMEFSGSSEMMRDLSAMNYSGSVSASPGVVHWAPSPGFGRMEHQATLPGIFERFQTSFGRGRYAGDAGNFEAAPTGISGRGLLEDAVREQHLGRVIALLEQGFSPNGERGSSKIPPLLIAVSTGNESLVKLLVEVGANVNGCDSRQYTALHYAAASGFLGMVDLLLAAGANIYAKTDGDLLPVQLATDLETLEYLSTRMNSDLEDRIGLYQAQFTSTEPPLRFPSFQRSSVNADQDQWTESAWLADNRLSEDAGSDRIVGEAVYRNVAPGFQGLEMLGPAQSFREGFHAHPEIAGIDRQNSLDFAGQDAAGSTRLMDWEAFRNSTPEPQSNEIFVHRSGSTNQSPNVVSEDCSSNAGFSQNMDVRMQDGTSLSRDSFTRPWFLQIPQEKPTLQRSSSAPAVPWHELNAFQPALFSQCSDPNCSQRSSCLNSAVVPRVPSAPSGLGQVSGVDTVQKTWSQKPEPLLKAISTESLAAASIYIPEVIETGSSDTDTNRAAETEVPMITDDDDNNVDDGDVDSEDDTNPGREHNAFKQFARACDSVAPSMIEKFRATSSSQSLDVTEMELNSEKALTGGPPQAPETPRQVGESQEKPDARVTESSQQASPSSQKGTTLSAAGVTPASALQGETTKWKEKRKGERKVTFALADSPREEDLALIREDWHEAARSDTGCVGCGKPGCEGQCLAPENPSSAFASEVASCSSSSPSNETLPKDLFPAPKSTRTGSVRWTRGELLGEGAYGKVFAGLNQDTGELMAVKQLRLDTAAEGQERQFYLAALEREISFYKTMRHKHIVGYIDMEQDLETGSLYVFLEYVSGGSIQSMLERFGRFSEPLVRVYTRQLLLGLEYLHGKKIVHRDIKGGNVLVDADGVIKLADFGASKAFHDPTQTDGFKSIRGSVFWMAPEVIKGDGYGRRADIWSVGCTVVEMLTAAHPWPGMDNTWTAIFHIAKASSGPPIPEGISSVVQDFLHLCFQLDPKKRPTSTELLQHPFVAESLPGSETL